MGLVLTTPPTVEPVTVAEVMAQSRIDVANLMAPPTAPTVALVSPAAPGNLSAGAYRYRLTFVTADGETDGGDISSAVTVADNSVNGQVRLTAIPTGPAGVTQRKIYRTGVSGSAYLFLHTLADNSTLVYTDNIADGSLGAGVPATNTTADPELSRLISAARRDAELHTGASFITQHWTLTLDRFPACKGDIKLAKGPVASIASIGYIDSAGGSQTLDEASYALESGQLSDRIRLAFGATWPDTRRQPAAVTIEYVGQTATSAANTPDNLKAALLMRVSDLYRNRESQTPQPLSANQAAVNLLESFVREWLV